MTKKRTKNSTRVSLSTRALHGTKLYPHKAPVAFPIYQTSTYRFESSEDAIRYAKGDPTVFVYSRYHNPTVQEVEEKIALLYGAEDAVLFSSGMAAITTTILAIAKPGNTILSTPALYGGTYRWFRDELHHYGINVRIIDPHNLATIVEYADTTTCIVYFETPTNPTLDIIDITEVAQQTARARAKIGKPILSIIDNTFGTVVNQNPLEMGIDVCIESATKYIGGHHDLLAGVVVGQNALCNRVRNVAKYLGGCLDPFAAFLLNRSLATLELRVLQHNANAFTLAKALENHPKVKRVLYPGLPSHPYHRIAKRQMRGFGGMVTIELQPSRKYTPAEAAAHVCDSLNVAVNAMSLGGVETLVSIPVFSSHVFMSDSELARHGVSPGMIRISVGLEGIDDLINDFTQALDTLR
ncbi:MAG: aminotransferase class I/II-fold pyridoxal phosphate-dependent enzyme [Bacteroidetes bacterium]|nr:aminotransferase class I/II-fold pyridoxal phosphate-dependent enzyme [Bacteroidota bacterium]